MISRSHYKLPQEQQQLRREANKLEWYSLLYLTTTVIAMYIVMGNSQAMKTAWVDDLLSMFPPIMILVCGKIESRPPSEKFPFGFHHSITISFIATATALTVLGLSMLGEAIHTLLKAEHPSIGTVLIFGNRIWLGWPMIVTLLLTTVPAVILGRQKIKLAKKLHDKSLHADAAMNKADWLSALAAALGVIGIGFGWWWADAIAAAFISLDITKDGITNIKRAFSQLLDERPTLVDKDEAYPIDQDLGVFLEQKNWVIEARPRLREEGITINGEIFVRTHENEPELPRKLEEATRECKNLNWRLYDLVLVPHVSTIKKSEN